MTREQEETRRLLKAAGWVCTIVWPVYHNGGRAVFRRSVQDHWAGGRSDWCEVDRDGYVEVK